MNLLSIIVPCYNEEAALPHFLKAIRLEAETLLKDEGQHDCGKDDLRGPAPLN